jgi:hypothetical protein
LANFREVLAHVATKVGTSTYMERRYGFEQTILASTARGVATYNDVIEFQTRKMAAVFFSITNVGAGPGTITVILQVQDPVSSSWVSLKTLAAFNSVSVKVLFIGPNVWPADADPVFGFNWPTLPASRMRLNQVVGVNSVTYSIGTVEMEYG